MSDLFSAPSYLEGLNPPQRDAVTVLDGPVLVLAGAGAGKTRVLTVRLAHLIATRRAWPSNILAVTFTNKAALEMRERVTALAGPMAQDLWLGTFHALAARILRRHADLLGLRANFVILDTDDQARLLSQLLSAFPIDAKLWPAKRLLGVIERWKDRGLPPGKVSRAEAGTLTDGKAIELYHAYQERLISLNACDFGDLLLHGLTLFTRHPDVLAVWQDKFRYLLVDEYQDTNVAQYLWLRLLAQKSKNICCVGDEDQSIYGWRGAEIENILRFEKDFPGARIVRLERNYRSTAPILSAAAAVIAHNRERLGKTLWTDAQGGEKVRVCAVLDGVEEAQLVAGEIQALWQQGHALGQMAILVRAGAQTRAFEERLVTLAIPHRVIGGLRFYERAEVRDAIAYLRLVHQSDDDLAFERIVNIPSRGLGLAAMQSLHRLAREQGLSLSLAAARLAASEELKPQPRSALAQFLADLERWRAMAGDIAPAELVQIILDGSGYMELWRADKSPQAPGRLDNLKELAAALAEFDSLTDFLEHVSLATERSANAIEDHVTLMTLHGAKGLEFDSVFLPGWEEGVFPNQRALEEKGGKGIEEERRLAYVGLTRARKRVIISYAACRRLYNQRQSARPSRFLAELPQNEIDVRTTGNIDRHVRDNGAHIMYDGPGWRTPAALPASMAVKTTPLASASRAEPVFSCNQRVFHQKFGYGTVVSAEGDRLDVAFDNAGRKKVIAGFVNAIDW